jgi:hypothetical protein
MINFHEEAFEIIGEYWYTCAVMPRFTKKQVFILPHAEEYRRQYHVSIEDVLFILNEPEEQEGLASDKL